MAALRGAPDHTLDHRVLLRLTWSRVFAADLNGVAVVDVATNSPPLSVRKQCGRLMAIMSATNFCTYALVSDSRFIPYGRIHLEALSTQSYN